MRLHTKKTNRTILNSTSNQHTPKNDIPQNPHITLKAISLFIPSTEDLENRPQNIFEMLVRETYANVSRTIEDMMECKPKNVIYI